MNSYEERQEARRARLEARAENAAGLSSQHFQKARGAVAGIPPGQPILVGHHSEARHRRDLARHDANMRRAIEADKKADDLAARAAAVGKGGISSDDPDAIPKLTAQLEQIEAAQAMMKAANKALRKGDDDALRALGMTPEQIEDLKRPDFAGRTGFPNYALTNNNANARRIRQRIKTLEAQAQQPQQPDTQQPQQPDTQGDGWTLRENIEENRIQFLFDGKPDPETRQTLKGHGFRWAPSQGAWQRHLNNAGRFAADEVSKRLGSNEATEH